MPLQDALYGLTFMLMNKHENNDVSEDAPIVLSTEMAVLSRDYNQELHFKGAVSRNSAKLGNDKMPVKLRET